MNILKQLFLKIKEDWEREELEANLYVLDCYRNRFVKGVSEGRYRFEDNERMIEFSDVLTDTLNRNYRIHGELSPFEQEVMKKALKDSLYDMSFFLLSHLNEEPIKEDIVRTLLKEGFQLLEGVGYIHTKRRIPYIVV